MKKLYIALLTAVLAALLVFTCISLFDKDAEYSTKENRKLAEKPEFSLSALLDGSYIAQLESYYTDTFPYRESMMDANHTLNRFYYYSGKNEEQNMLIISGNTGAESGGQSLHETLEKEELTVVEETAEEELPEESTAEAPEQKPEEEPLPEQTQQPAKIDLPSESDAAYCGNVVVFGTRAMEIPTADHKIIGYYADAVRSISEALGSDVRIISLVTPNGGEFYSPESMHTGVHSQADMIRDCYEKMPEDVLTVDAYSALSQHADEYLFFRTDHHWTQLGAYYAYTKFCETCGFEAVPLTDFTQGTYENFVGSMYTFTSGYPQSQLLYDNPDTLTYYLPKFETHAKYYSDSTLYDPISISVIYTKLPDTTLNKYLCYIGGDTPVCIIESEAEGGTCMVLKESYGNAFVPFLTSHYSRIIVIDPREFNQNGKPSLDLPAFAKEQGVDDLLIINYPYMINNINYIHLLFRLIGQDHTLSQ